MISNKIREKEFFMELVYLWVEDYKNIQKQGFNFSPRFMCEYDEDTKELKVVDKDETGEFYPKNFFGDNINVTAIVGENGSGKSSIGEAFKDIFINSRLSNGKNYILVYRENDEDYFYDSSIDININGLNCISKKINENLMLYLSQDSYSKDMMIDKHKVFSVSSSKKSTINGLLNNKIMRPSNDFKITSFMYMPKKIKIKLKDIESLMNESISQNIGGWSFLSDMNYLDAIKKDILMAYSNKYYQYLAFAYISYSNEEKDENFVLNIQTQDKLIEILIEKKLFMNQESFEKINCQIDIDLDKLDEDIKKIIQSGHYFDYLDIDFTDEQSRSYKDLSSGEKQIFGQFLNIYFYSIEHTNNQLYFLDEPDNMLHPNWQKAYVKELLILLKNTQINYHILLASHSPFILSDLPKENVIFLEKDEKTGKSINATNNIDINPFGANIHTLLSHGFFMKDGLMGEFAKSKIDDVIKYLNNDKKSTITTDEDAQNIINIIGEPIIKRELQRMLKNKMELSNKTEIDTIKNEIKLLTERLEKLEPKDDK
jgi:predicted ATPase